MNNAGILKIAAALGAALALCTQGAMARDYIHIVGSSTVAPFSKAVAEQLGTGGTEKLGKKGTKKAVAGLKSPWLESTGTKGGIQLFCESNSEDSVDIVNAVRRMTKREYEQCRNNGVNEIVEIAIGRDAMVFAQSAKSPAMNLTRRDLYNALSRMIPSTDRKLRLNTNKTWKQINAALPDRKIEVIGPPANSGFREIFQDMVLEPGCDGFPWLSAQRATMTQDYKKACQDVRTDQAYIQVTVNDDLVVRELVGNDHALGLVSYSLYLRNKDKLSALEIDGVAPKSDTITSELYPLSGELYIYVKKSHLDYIPGLARFIQEFTSERAFGDKGYLVVKNGLIPLAQVDRKVSTDIAKTFAPMMTAPTE